MWVMGCHVIYFDGTDSGNGNGMQRDSVHTWDATCPHPGSRLWVTFVLEPWSGHHWRAGSHIGYFKLGTQPWGLGPLWCDLFIISVGDLAPSRIPLFVLGLAFLYPLSKFHHSPVHPDVPITYISEKSEAIRHGISELLSLYLNNYLHRTFSPLLFFICRAKWIVLSLVQSKHSPLHTGSQLLVSPGGPSYIINLSRLSIFNLLSLQAPFLQRI